jgi:DNA mismatch repair ATPase MutS
MTGILTSLFIKVIMDEVGRGTTVNDGLAIAFATVHHLVSVNRCRALFATHFHELSDMLGIVANNKGRGVFEKVAFFCTDIDETNVRHHST